MKRFIIIVIILALAACRGEPVPRDYQNAPPDMTHPPQTATQSPGQHGQGTPVPEPSTGAEGKAAPDKAVEPPPQPQTTTMPDTPPVTTTT
ncbi:MAG TPA: hypothetical protein VKB93_09045 [Thermoanaerobaculia bacterium]|nr:hypothetical protein [Thermoanaerobaculia bacterium]